MAKDREGLRSPKGRGNDPAPVKRRRKGSKLHVLAKAIARGLRVTTNGQVIFPSGRASRAKKRDRGYRVVHISVDGETLTVLVARIVCWQHHGPPPSPDHEVDHINNNHSDDRPENLRWLTSRTNAGSVSTEERRRRRAKMQAMRRPQGEKHGNARFTNEDIREIRRLSGSGVSQKKIAAMFGTGQGYISLIVRRRKWAHLP
jgi:hypothetical protein